MMVDTATLRILYFPHPALRQKAEDIKSIDENTHAVAQRMIELMHKAEGVGLAGPQVGLPWRIFVTSAAAEDEVDRVYINPRLTNLTGPIESKEEGCLSLPEIHVDVRRPTQVTITASDLDGNEFTLTVDGLLARVWQHENDHLNGILIIDRMSPMDRLATRKAIKELEADAMKG